MGSGAGFENPFFALSDAVFGTTVQAFGNTWITKWSTSGGGSAAMLLSLGTSGSITQVVGDGGYIYWIDLDSLRYQLCRAC